MSEFSDQEQAKRQIKKKNFTASLLAVIVIVVIGFAALYYIVSVTSNLKKKGNNTEQSGNSESGKDGKDASKGNAKKKEEEKPKVKVYKVDKENFIHVMNSLGTVTAKSKVNLRFEVNGVIDAVNVKEGDSVREGGVIAEIVHTDAELKVDFRKSKLKEAKIEEKNWRVKVKMNKELLDAGAITQNKYDESVFAQKRAKQAAKSAKIELQSAEAELNKTFLQSPIDGIVGEIKAFKGEFVTSQKQIFSIMEISEVYCEFSVLEKDIQDVVEDLDIYLYVDTYPGERFQGTITSMGAVVTSVQGRSRKAKAIVSNDDSKLLPGMFTHVEVVLLQREDALTVPVSSFLDIEKDTSFVWIVGEGDKVRKQEISVEHFNLEKALIESGLKVGDLVVTDVALVKLKEGGQVEIVEVKEVNKEKK